MPIDPVVFEYVADEEDYPDKAVIVEEGSRGHWLYVVVKGKVKVRKVTSRGVVNLETLKEGAIFGEIGFFQPGEGTRTASVIADGPVKIGVLDSERLMTEWQMVSLQLRELLTTLMMRLGKANERAVAMLVESG